jgi:hypothetical protein
MIAGAVKLSRVIAAGTLRRLLSTERARRVSPIDSIGCLGGLADHWRRAWSLASPLHNRFTLLRIGEDTLSDSDAWRFMGGTGICG